jgi:hypothetical protein
MPQTQRLLEARAVTHGPAHHFFGYYDKSPWDRSGRYLLCLATETPLQALTGTEVARIELVDLQASPGTPPRILAETRAWCWQQGSMLQWLPGAEDRLIIYNQLQDDRFVAIIQDVWTGEQRVLSRPIYALSPNGREAVSVNFSRLAWARPGYGYPALPDPWRQVSAPEDDGIYRVDLESGESQMLFSLAQLAATQPDDRMADCYHWFNHLQYNADGSRFLFLHRWGPPGMFRQTRLYTAQPDGSHRYLVSDHDMVSHFDWLGRDQILAWARRHGVGDRYFLFRDRSSDFQVLGEEVFNCDGHCSFSPDEQWLMTDTYPNREHIRTLMLYHLASNHRIDIGRFYSPPAQHGEIRCDLHPRWRADGRQVCIDSAHGDGTRQMYLLDLEPLRPE